MLQKKECGGMKAKCKVALEKCLDTSLDDSEATLRIFFVGDKLSRTLDLTYMMLHYRYWFISFLNTICSDKPFITGQFASDGSCKRASASTA